MLHQSNWVAIAMLSTVLMATSYGQELVTWQDPSKHQVRLVTEEEGVGLEVLDWGGSGRAVVMLAGSGNTAHVFDDFAPRLTACCHVYGSTRRGYGASSQPASGYDDQRLADDVLQVLNSLRAVCGGLVTEAGANDGASSLNSMFRRRWCHR